MQEEQAALSPPASGAERPDGSDSAPSDSARWGLVAISSDERHGGKCFRVPGAKNSFLKYILGIFRAVLPSSDPTLSHLRCLGIFSLMSEDE